MSVELSRRGRRERRLLRSATLAAVAVVVVACTVLTPLADADAGAASRSTAPRLKDPDATARKLVTGWLTALHDKDSDEIAASLAPNFQIERADGTGTDRAGYLAKPAVVDEFTLGDEVVALQSGNSLTVRWSITVSEQIGENQVRAVEAPRLTTFVWLDGRWKILSYANFNPIE